MKKYAQLIGLAAVATLGISLGSEARAALVDFESFADGDLLVSEVPGLTVSGGTVLTAGVGLNEIDFPPTSGDNVLAALSGPLSLDFSVVTTAKAFLVAAQQVTVSAFDPSDQLLATFDAPFAVNLGAPQLFDFSWAGASRYSLSSTQAFVIDDLSFAAVTFNTPEPSTLPLSGLVLAALALLSRRRSAPAEVAAGIR